MPQAHIRCHKPKLNDIIYRKVGYMAFKKAWSWAIVLLLLIAIMASALWLRVALPYNQVFVGDWVKMTGVDAYYYMRLVDNLMAHFPQLTRFDPYLLYPSGWATGAQPDFFAYFMGGVIWLLSLGNADQHTVDVISVYIPPVLAVVTVLATFLIGMMLGAGGWGCYPPVCWPLYRGSSSTGPCWAIQTIISPKSCSRHAACCSPSWR